MYQPVAPPRSDGIVRRALRGVGVGIDRSFGALSTAVLLAVVATIPIAQFFALGYLLHAAGRLATTGKLREGFVGVKESSRIGQIVLGSWLVTLPYRLLDSLYADALLIAPDSTAARRLFGFRLLCALLAGWVVLAALAQGGALVHFVRPLRATKLTFRAIREGGFVAHSWQRLRSFVGGFAVQRTWWLGARGYLGAGLWLAVPTTLIALGRKGPIAVVGALLLAWAVMHVPFLQIHMAVNDRLKSIFELRAVRQLYACAPLAFSIALASTLLLALPLYLLKIELVPRDTLWLPAVVFITTIFPTKLLTGWAYRRAAKRREPAHFVWRWLGRVWMLAVALVYALVVFLTQYTGWHGVLGLYEHHAFLLPVPF
jgi:hypothetical protein